MLKVLNCVAYQHDTRLVAVSALICMLGCYTTTALLTRASKSGRRRARPWLIGAAAAFGCSVWSLHFVAMLAFMPGQQMAYHVGLTALSALVASAGAFAAFTAWSTRTSARSRIVSGGVLLGLSVSGMHYTGVAAMSFSGFLLFDHGYVAASVVSSICFSIVGFARASGFGTKRNHLEVASWFAVGIVGVHFLGMAAITIAPGAADTSSGTVLGTTLLATAVGSVSIAILISSLAAVTIEQHLSQRALRSSAACG